MVNVRFRTRPEALTQPNNLMGHPAWAKCLRVGPPAMLACWIEEQLVTKQTRHES